MEDLNEIKKEIGCRIRAIREANKLTQEKMADVLDIGSTSHYQNIENGRFFPSYKYYERLKEKFNVSADYILFGEVRNEDDFIFKFELLSPENKQKCFNKLVSYMCGVKDNK